MEIDWESLYPDLKHQVDRIIDENLVVGIYLIGSGIKKLNNPEEFREMRDVDILVVLEYGEPEREVIEENGVLFDISYLSIGFVYEYKDYENSFLYAAWRKKHMLFEPKSGDVVGKNSSFYKEPLSKESGYFETNTVLDKLKTDKVFSTAVGGFLLGDWLLIVEKKFKEWKEHTGVPKDFKELQLMFLMDCTAYDVVCLLFKFEGRWPVVKKKFIDELLNSDREIFDLYKVFIKERNVEKKYQQFKSLVEASAKRFGGIRKTLVRSYFPPEL